MEGRTGEDLIHEAEPEDLRLPDQRRQDRALVRNDVRVVTNHVPSADMLTT